MIIEGDDTDCKVGAKLRLVIVSQGRSGTRR
jgi:hypothetical protein